MFIGAPRRMEPVNRVGNLSDPPMGSFTMKNLRPVVASLYKLLQVSAISSPVFFGGRVQPHRMVDVVLHAKRHVRVDAVDAGAAGVDEVLDAGLTAALEDVDESDQVAEVLCSCAMRISTSVSFGKQEPP